MIFNVLLYIYFRIASIKHLLVITTDMEGSLYGKYVNVSVLLLILLNSSCVSSFSTQACTHDQIEKHLRTTLNCIMATDDSQVAEMKGHKTNTTEWCELMDAEIECFTKNLGTCFNKDMTSDFAILMEWALYDNNTCNRIDGDYRGEIDRKKEEIINKLKKDIESSKDIVNFDQECSTEVLIISLEVLKPCVIMHFYSIILNIHSPKPTESKSIPVCENVVGILNGCVTQTTDCLSQTEMSLIQDFLATCYYVFMEFVVQSAAKSGSVFNFMDFFGVDEADLFDGSFSSQRKTTIMKKMDTIVEDYKVNY